MFALKEKSKSDSSMGITFSDDGIALAIVKRGSLSPILEVCEFIPCQPKDQSTELERLSKQYSLDLLPCNCVLLPGEFELLQVDAPDVSSEEIASALQWQIKDLINFHIDDAVIDYIKLPNESTSGKDQLLVVTSRASVIRQYVEQLQLANINLKTVDVAVQAARNLICRKLESLTDNSIGLLNLWPEVAKISVILNDNVYINRSSDIGLTSLNSVTDDDINSQFILDSLALELQRTFDYYESHSRQASISQLVIISNKEPAQKLAEMLQARLGIECFNLDINDIITPVENIDNVDYRCITAIGGALRDFA